MHVCALCEAESFIAAGELSALALQCSTILFAFSAPVNMSTGPPTAVMARLGCARMVLMRGRARRTTDEQKQLSKIQVDAIVSEMQVNTSEMKRMDPGAASRMSSLASSVPWAEGHLGVVLEQMRRC